MRNSPLRPMHGDALHRRVIWVDTVRVRDVASVLARLDRGLRAMGYDAFRPGQREAIELLVSRGKLLYVAPTGGGKSLCYQLPASLFAGTSIIVSPLIALMHDQVRGLSARGVAATFLASTLDGHEMRSRMRNMARGTYKLVYVAPERLAYPGFRSLVADMRCPMVAVDEAHCISEWGHDFRPDYMAIGGVLAQMPDVRVLACTATATPVVRDEIMLRLGLPSDAPQVISGFARPNLVLRARDVSGTKESVAQVDLQLDETLGSPYEARDGGAAIIYAPTRKAAEQQTQRLAALDWRVGCYHAGLAPIARDRAQDQFLGGNLDVVVATNAFGMGIDRSDVRAVIHLAPPGSIEAYYQEVGRAGRDGETAYGLMLVSNRDFALRRQLLSKDGAGNSIEPEIVEHKWQLFLELMRWSEGGSCRHDAILRYFGDEAEVLGGCGRCDACQTLASEGRDDAAVSLIVRKALSAVARVNGRFGMMAVVKLLLGQVDPRLTRVGLDRTRTFGALAGEAERWVTRLLGRCITAGWVEISHDSRPVVSLSRGGIAVMKGESPVRLLLPGRASVSVSSRRETRAKVPPPELSAAATHLFEALRRCRSALAREASVPPYVVASDRALRELAMLRPRSRDELLAVHGIGPAKVERYGAALLQVVQQVD
ncbi:MAG: ATP-dependent DNA helicase RecQ [Nannocystaceae bacterium]